MNSKSFYSKFYKDAYIQGLIIWEKFTYKYYCFNELVNWLGCYEITDRTVLFDLGEEITKDVLQTMKDKFQLDGKILFVDNYVILKNSERYDKILNNNQLMGTALKQFQELPSHIKLAFLSFKPREVIEEYTRIFSNLGYDINSNLQVGYEKPTSRLRRRIIKKNKKEEEVKEETGGSRGDKPKGVELLRRKVAQIKGMG